MLMYKTTDNRVKRRHNLKITAVKYATSTVVLQSVVALNGILPVYDRAGALVFSIEWKHGLTAAQIINMFKRLRLLAYLTNCGADNGLATFKTLSEELNGLFFATPMPKHWILEMTQADLVKWAADVLHYPMSVSPQPRLVVASRFLEWCINNQKLFKKFSLLNYTKNKK